MDTSAPLQSPRINSGINRARVASTNLRIPITGPSVSFSLLQLFYGFFCELLTER
ncbi:hypothetical protein GCK32_000162 [Trichostrongylus colubriformis]|uniref:Uncharacterized protein n=1 Tax=Trichostrongylus colubriformis TaxID=6319 RepID=A0AAN8FHN0_TRICO